MSSSSHIVARSEHAEIPATWQHESSHGSDDCQSPLTGCAHAITKYKETKGYGEGSAKKHRNYM